MCQLKALCRAVAIMVVIGIATFRVVPVNAQTVTYNRANVVTGLCSGETSSTTRAVDVLLAEVASKREAADWAGTIINALGAKELLCSKDGESLLETEAGYLDPVTMSVVTIDGKPPRAPFVNLKVRANLNVAASLLSLIENPAGPNAGDAVSVLEKRYDYVDATVLALALDGVVDPDLRDRLKVVQSLKILQSDDVADVDTRIQAIEAIADIPTERNRTALINLQQRDGFADSDPRLVRALEVAIDEVGTWIQIGNIGAVLFSGLSYASILFMASLGLAIIFGLMGVINLAQGEFIMVGSYATFMVQEVLRLWAPGLLDWYLVISIPVAFLVTAAVGMILEVTVIRHLYGRPLMTLLATWAISLFLINLVRVAFGTQNLEFIVPSFLSGGVRVTADFIITWSRLFAIGFSAAVLISVLLLVHKTRWGLYIRGVTENRAMASCVGVSSRRIDSISFGLGSGLAGLAGLVLTPIYSVNPTMGTNFIVDSFMVVVLGGVGNVAGTLISALTIGQINIVIEPIYGAVAAKVIVLLMIIVFIQFRPQGIFAVKGRK
ncbi:MULTISPECIES: urea ABC transporter permease subunit UrtB [unclassified Thalassospira]|nr:MULTISPECIES: urea ABC transporter permease subunit UrtB [unclassified Thalassospira]HAI31384.1 urea ABC transporter permease subunit UrtB [Thalassospira sp.]